MSPFFDDAPLFRNLFDGHMARKGAYVVVIEVDTDGTGCPLPDGCCGVHVLSGVGPGNNNMGIGGWFAACLPWKDLEPLTPMAFVMKAAWS